MELFCKMNGIFSFFSFYITLFCCIIFSLYVVGRDIEKKMRIKQSKFNIYYFLLSGLPSPGPGAISFSDIIEKRREIDKEKDVDLILMINARNKFGFLSFSLFFIAFLLSVYFLRYC